MRAWRALAGALGVLALGLAYGSPGGLLPLESVVSRLGNDYVLVAGIAGLVLALVVPVLVSGRAGKVTIEQMPDPESPVGLPVPGDEFDAALGRWTTSLPLVGGRRRRAVRSRLRDAAVEVVARSDPCSRADAERRVDGGRWTTDPVAAGFLARTRLDGPRPGALARTLLVGETGFQRRTRRTVDAIAAYTARSREVTDGGLERD